MTEINYDELIFKLKEQNNNILSLAHKGRIDEQDFDLYQKALKVLTNLWEEQKAYAFINKHMCNACLDELVQTFPQFDYNLCFDCCAIVIGEHLTDWCQVL